MPNWCMTDIVIYTKDKTDAAKSQIESCHDRLISLQEATENGTLENHDWGGLWLGNIVTDLLKDTEAWRNYACRGQVDDIQMIQESEEHFYFFLATQDAWFTQLATWDLLMAQDEYQALGYYYLAEEPGCDIYENSDSDREFFTESFLIDVCPETKQFDYSYEYFDTEEEVIRFVNTVYEPVNSLEDVEKLFGEMEEKDGGMFRLRAFETP